MSKKIIAKSGGQLQPERPGHFHPEKGGQFHPEKAGVLIRNIQYPRKLVEKYNLILNRDYRIFGKGSETENSSRAELARQRTFIEVIKFLKFNNTDSTEAENDFKELQKYM